MSDRKCTIDGIDYYCIPVYEGEPAFDLGDGAPNPKFNWLGWRRDRAAGPVWIAAPVPTEELEQAGTAIPTTQVEIRHRSKKFADEIMEHIKEERIRDVLFRCWEVAWMAGYEAGLTAPRTNSEKG